MNRKKAICKIDIPDELTKGKEYEVYGEHLQEPVKTILIVNDLGFFYWYSIELFESPI